MATTVFNIIERCAKNANDLEFDDFEAVDWFEWINDAQRAVCLVRPDAKTEVITFQAAVGTKQTLPAGSRRLTALTRNMGSDGSTEGRAITGPVLRDMLDAYNPDWHKPANHDTEVKQYMYDESMPDTFYVYPGVSTGTTLYLEAKVVKDPSDVSDHESNLDIPDSYAPAVIEWCLYRAWSSDTERSPNWARAGAKYQAFFNLLGVKLRSDLAVSPKVIENGRQHEGSAA